MNTLLRWSGALLSGRHTFASLFTTVPSGISSATTFLSSDIYLLHSGPGAS